MVVEVLVFTLVLIVACLIVGTVTEMFINLCRRVKEIHTMLFK